MLSFNDNLRVRYESNSRFMGIFSWVISNAIGFAILRRLSTSEIGGWYFSFSLSVCISSTPAAALLSKYGSSSTFGISLRRLSNGFGSATVVLIAGMSSHVDRSARILMLGPEIFSTFECNYAYSASWMGNFICCRSWCDVVFG